MADDSRTPRPGQNKIIVVGAGISGLTAAYRLQKAGFAVTVLEALDHVGGRASTVHKQGYTIDTGAGALFESYTAYLALAAELGLKDQIKRSSQIIGVIRDFRIHTLSTKNIYLSGLTTGLLSWSAKFRLLRAFFDIRRANAKGQLSYTDLTRAEPLDFETASQCAQRRLDPELLTYFGAPTRPWPVHWLYRGCELRALDERERRGGALARTAGHRARVPGGEWQRGDDACASLEGGSADEQGECVPRGGRFQQGARHELADPVRLRLT